MMIKEQEESVKALTEMIVENASHSAGKAIVKSL